MQQQQPGGADGAALPPATGATGTAAARSRANGGRFDFDDGGTYCGGWEEGKAHGHGVCTGPKGQGAYAGSWHFGFEVSGVYTWPSGSCFEGQWQNGKRHGLGVEARGRWVYRGEWTQGFKGRYGVRQSSASAAKYEGTWAHGLQDGCGSETYADGGTYQGQWMRGMRHGYGARHSAPFGKASKQRGAAGGAAGGRGGAAPARAGSLASLADGAGGPADAVERRDRHADDGRGGFVLKANSGEPTRRGSVGGAGKRGLFGGLLRKPLSLGDLDKRGNSGSIRSTGSTASWVSTDSAGSAMTAASGPSDSNASFVVEDEHLDPSVTETYMGEWKNDKRSGYGVSERSDGLKYEGEWYNNKKYGYGVTTFSNGEKEEGKYKNNVLVTSSKKKLFLMRSAKFRERLDAAVYAAQRASKIALQKADIAITRTAAARSKAEQADLAAAQAREDAIVAESVAKQYAPDFVQPDLKRVRDRRNKYREQGTTLHESLDINIGLDKKPMNPNLAAAPNVPNYTANKMPNEGPMLQPNHIGNNPHATTAKYPPQNPTYGNPAPTNNPSGNPGPAHNATTNDFGAGFKEQRPAGAPLPHNNVGSNPGNEYPGAPPKRNSMVDESPRAAPAPRRQSRMSNDRPYLSNIGQQSSIDHFDHYKRPPSRDSSVDRYQKVTGRLNSQSRQPSVDRTALASPGVGAGRPSETPDRTARAPSAVRGTTPAPQGTGMPARNGSVVSGQGANSIGNSNGNASPPFEDIILRKRNLGQDIIPSPNQPKRTESLFIPGQPAAQPTAKILATQTSLARKKSLPDVQEMPRQVPMMSREEVSVLGSMRREEVRRQIDESERLRANPLLWLVSPQVKDWFSRQQLVIVVLFINISLAIMFFKLLT